MFKQVGAFLRVMKSCTFPKNRNPWRYYILYVMCSLVMYIMLLNISYAFSFEVTAISWTLQSFRKIAYYLHNSHFDLWIVMRIDVNGTMIIFIHNFKIVNYISFWKSLLLVILYNLPHLFMNPLRWFCDNVHTPM